MGSIIPQAADTRIIMPNCLFMIHDGSTNLEGTHKQVQSAAQLEEKMRDQMLDVYASVCVNGHYFQKEQATDKKVREYIIAKMNEKEDWWLTAREAVAFGFADAVLGDEGYDNIESTRDSIINGE
jgi:ATP-dependent protease ClpP protease subunit